MAAAEYFSNAPMMSSSHQYSPPSQHSYPQHYVPNPTHSSPHLQTQGPPPPYQEQTPGVHFAPPPTNLDQRHSFSGQQRPSIPSSPWSQPSQPGYGQYPPQNMLAQQRPHHSYGTAPQKPQHLSPHTRPYANHNSSQYSLDGGGYSSDPEPHRRRHKHRERRDSGRARSGRSSSSRSTNADAFVGAAGGGLIGDLIFPGLGTVGGAVAGWLGGKDYGKHRKGREDRRSKEQREWEDKWRPHHRHRSRSNDRSSRGSSTQLGEVDARRSYDRRDSRY